MFDSHPWKSLCTPRLHFCPCLIENAKKSDKTHLFQTSFKKPWNCLSHRPTSRHWPKCFLSKSKAYKVSLEKQLEKVAKSKYATLGYICVIFQWCNPFQHQKVAWLPRLTSKPQKSRSFSRTWNPSGVVFCVRFFLRRKYPFHALHF